MTGIRKNVQPLLLHGVFQRFIEKPSHLREMVVAVCDYIFPRDPTDLALCEKENLKELIVCEAFKVYRSNRLCSEFNHLAHLHFGIVGFFS